MSSSPYRPPVADPLPFNRSSPTMDQLIVLYMIPVFAIIIYGLWNIPGARLLISPLKLFTIGAHEMSHILVAILTGGKVLKVCIDPLQGGATIVEGGYGKAILPAGYIGSSLVGALFVSAGFDTLLAKAASFVFAIGLLCPLFLVRDKLTIILTGLYEVLLIAFWFVDHAQALRWYCLFLGVMNALYVVWDLTDDKLFRKPNDSDCTQFNLLWPAIHAHVWAGIWLTFQCGVLIGFIFCGISQFRYTQDQMYYEAGMLKSENLNSSSDSRIISCLLANMIYKPLAFYLLTSCELIRANYCYWEHVLESGFSSMGIRAVFMIALPMTMKRKLGED